MSEGEKLLLTKKQSDYLNFLNKWKKTVKLQPSNGSHEHMIAFFRKNEINLPKENLIFVYQFEDFQPLYVTPNIKNVLGYSQEEYLKLGYESHMPPDGYENFRYLEELIVCQKEFLLAKKETGLKFTRFESFIFGRQIQSKTGDIQHFLLCNSNIMDENQNVPQTSIITFHQIDHFLNSTPTLWFLFKAISDEGQVCNFIKYDESRHVATRLISEREREVFNYISRGKSSKEVAIILNLSSETIDKHRKNVINRLGVNNTTSLIQILKICGEL